jgi:SET domain-containing protein
MFLIPTYLAPSRIHGTGVFTPEPIKAGTLIWKFNAATDWKIKPAEMERFPEPYRSRLFVYCYIDTEGLYVLCGDNAKFMNHSEESNCDDKGDQYTIARRDIEAHEELTCDYRSFDAESAGKKGKLY